MNTPPLQNPEQSESMVPYHQGLSSLIKHPYHDEKTPFDSIMFGLKAAFSPGLTRTMGKYGELKRFEDLDVDKISHMVRGLILDVGGTMTDGISDFSPEVVEKLREIRAKIPACIYCNDNRNWPIFEQLGIPVAKNLPKKPDPRGFDVAMQLHLQNSKRGNRIMEHEEVAVVGNNRLTDGGCRQIGMHFIHVDTLRPEGTKSNLVETFGNGITLIHRNLEKIGKRFGKKTSSKPEEKVGFHPLVQALLEKRKRPNLPLQLPKSLNKL